MKCLFLIYVLTLTNQALATVKSPNIFDYFFDDINAGYKNCVSNRELIKAEKGFFIDVPIDHKNLSQGSLKIYAFFRNPYNPKLPTYIYFDGGPGGNSHNSPSLTNSFNELHFDQRGVGCSQPSEPQTLVDFNFYSSEAIALDAEVIRRTLRIERVSIFGGSYGTIPATIYAHLFPAHTVSVVLEGVVYSEGNLALSPTYFKAIEQVYSRLSPKTKSQVDLFFQGEKSILFARIIRNYLKLNFGIENAIRYLELLFSISEEYDEARIQRAIKRIPGLIPKPLDRAQSILSSTKTYPNQDKFDLLKKMNLLILNCKENPGNVKALNTEIALAKGRFVVKSIPGENLCEAFRIPPNPKPYRAMDYPIRKPVTYFQGFLDSRSNYVDAIKHFVRNAQSDAQLLLAAKGGHGPFTEVLSNPPNSDVQEAYLEVLHKSLRGEILSEADLKRINSLVPLKWEQSSRIQNSIYKISPIVVRATF